MNPERWDLIDEVYHSVLASPVSRRGAMLDELCLDDLEIRREVESLLDARENAGGFLSSASLQSHITELFSASELAGRELGHYKIVSSIGAGATGEVYLALDTRLDRQVALKILTAQFTEDGNGVARFRREARAASALNHPNIIAIYDIGQIGDTWFIAAEFVQGITLRDRTAAAKMEWQELLAIGIQCALALEAAHRAGIVHRDIKPENIMLRPDGVVKVVDFGLARVMEAEPEGDVERTQAGAVVGTPRYMSPEQARGQRVDARTDIFSLGAVMYELATGRPAFPGTTAPEVFAALLSTEPGPPTECADGIPEDFDRVVLKSLEKSREARYQTMCELRTELEALRDQRKVCIAPRLGKRGPERPTDDSRRKGHKLGGATIAAIALIAGLVLLWYASTIRPGRQAEAPAQAVVPLTSFAGYKDFGSLSADGSEIAFSWNGGKRGSPVRNVYVKNVGSDEPRQLTFAAQDDRVPVWSPDGKYVAFCRSLDPQPVPRRYAIYIVPADGGAERKVVEGGMGVSWAPDGKTLAVAGTRDDSGGVFLISLETGKRRQLTSPDPYLDTLPVFSPNGQWVTFTRDFGFSARELFVIRADGGPARRLTFDQEPTYGSAWTANGREIVFASNRGIGGESLWRIAAQGGAPSRLSATLEGGFYPSISRQGDRLVYTESFKNTNTYLYEGVGFGNRSTAGRFGEPTGLALSSRRDDSPSTSPDGERFAFVSNRTGNEEIWVCKRNGGGLVQLTSFHGPATGTPRWSPDGSSIAFDSSASGNSEIYIISADGGASRRLTTGPSANFMPSWSPDGKWVYFKSDRSGSDQIWKMLLGGGEAVQVTRGGAVEAFASPDGKLVYYTKRPWGAIWTVPVDGGPESPLLELKRFDKIFRSWGVVDQGIYFISRQDSVHQTIRFFSFATRQVTALVTLDRDPIWDYPDVALSRDGRRLLVACLDQEVDDLMLIEHFH